MKLDEAPIALVRREPEKVNEPDPRGSPMSITPPPSGFT
jgi:hypothetical protein